MAVLREKFIAMSEYINNTERPQINDLMTEKHVKKCLSSWAIKEMKMKTTL
jgi:hypothetical protein